MKLDILSTLYIASSVFNIVFAKDIPILDFNSSGAACGPVYSSGKGAEVFFYIEEFEVDNETNLEEIRIPFTLFRYSDIAYFNNFPEPDDFRFEYKNSSEARLKLFDGLVDFDINKFIVERNNISLSGILDEPNVRTGYLEYKRDKTQQLITQIDIGKSGMYCLYIAPPISKGIKKLVIPVDHKDSFGNFSLRDYGSFYSLKLSFIIGVVMVVCLSLYSSSKKGLKERIIPTWLVIYGLLPLLAAQAILMVPFILVNHTEHMVSEGNNRTILKYSNILISWINTVLEVAKYYFALLFSMGVGIIYLAGYSSDQLRKFPTLLHRKAKYLLAFNLLLNSMEFVFTEIINIDAIDVIEVYGELSIVKIIFLGLMFLNSFMWVIWWLFSFYHYFITKISIAKYPKFEEPGVGKKVIKAFRNSLLVIALTNNLLLFLRNAFKNIVSMWETLSNMEYLESILDVKKAQFVSKSVEFEDSIFSFFSWEDTFFDKYITIFFLFLIWFKDFKSKN